MSLLSFTDVTVEIQRRERVVRPLDGVSFHVERGESVGLVGESGSGKTMCALALMRLLPHGGRQVDGQIVLNGQDLSEVSDRDYRSLRGNEIGMIFQDPMNALNPTMPVGIQVAESLRLHRGLDRRAAHEAAVATLERVGMPQAADRARQYPHQLSGGMRQRAMIAMALACDPSVLIADEPTTALDVTIQRQILDLLDNLRRELHTAVLLVTHDLGVVAGRTDRVVVMYGGRVMEVGRTSQVLGDPAHPYTRALLHAIPERALATGVPLQPIPGRPPEPAGRPTGCPFAARCPHVAARCHTDTPPLREFDDGRFAACHFVPLSSATTYPTLVVEPTRPSQPDADRSDTTAELELRAVSKQFSLAAGVFGGKETVSAVSDVSLHLPARRTLGLVGESGCGKTTIGRIIVGLEQPTTGEVRIAGQQFGRTRGAQKRDLRRAVQFMFQDSYASMDPRMTIADVLGEPLAINGIGTGRSRRQQAAAALDEVGLSHTALDRYPHEFSGGQRQRIGLARALALSPRIVVADEPVSSLDVSVQAQILNLMAEAQRQRDVTYIFISHDLNVVRYIADTIAVMYLGRLVEVGPADQVYRHPRHPYTAGLLAASPSVLARKGVSLAPIGGELPSASKPPSGCRFRTRCPRAQSVCAEVVPELRTASGAADPVPTGNAHVAACHFPLDDAPVAPAALTKQGEP